MSGKGLPQIGGDFVQLVASLRDAMAKMEKYHRQGDKRRVDQIGALVDSKIAAWLLELQKWEKWSGQLHTDEMPGVYDVIQKG